ncbi:hypothetical protein AX17_000199 [Amanita inopinata Kibby_2008]|nr:hypothetical protein AX17_000199 [Amanita inopinata Kibby_2008]
MAGGERERRVIPANPPRWTPNPDPTSIHVPGLDTAAAVHDQIEQIEQLITIKLQNIDENFSKIHHLLANKLLPAVKRYAVGTEPVRDAAMFWTSFYEQAAQIRIPTFDDYMSVNENTSERDDLDSTTQQESGSHVSASVLEEHLAEASMMSTENSFMPGQHAYSSTPATARTTRTYSDDLSDAGPSWAASMESPLVRLDREIQSLTREDETLQPSERADQSSVYIDNGADDTFRTERSQIPPPSNKGKGREEQTLLRSVLKQNLFTGEATPGDTIKAVSPLKFKGKTKTPIPKKRNPYLPASVEPEKWDGIVDLSTATPRGLRKREATGRPTTPTKDDDDSFDGLPLGMSPPVLMSPARPPRSSAELGFLKLGKTPVREASARISNDLVREIQQKSAQARRMFGYPVGGADSTTTSTVPTPPSLSRYNRPATDSSLSTITDPSLESMMRRVGLSVAGEDLESQSHNGSFDSLDNSAGELDVELRDSLPPTHVDTQHDSDSDSDSLDEINNTAHPSAAFLMASQGRAEDDSFGSSNHSDDSLIAEEAANLGIAPVHPFARGVESNVFEDDSFDDESMLGGGGDFQEETLFGVPPAERLRAEQMRAANQGELRMLGDDLLQDTIGIGAQLARTGRVEETPTPAYSWDRQQT